MELGAIMEIAAKYGMMGAYAVAVTWAYWRSLQKIDDLQEKRIAENKAHLDVAHSVKNSLDDNTRNMQVLTAKVEALIK